MYYDNNCCIDKYRISICSISFYNEILVIHFMYKTISILILILILQGCSWCLNKVDTLTDEPPLDYQRMEREQAWLRGE